MSDDSKAYKDSQSSSTKAHCPHCGDSVYRLGTIKTGTESVSIYRCQGCKKEFVDEELRKKSK